MGAVGSDGLGGVAIVEGARDETVAGVAVVVATALVVFAVAVVVGVVGNPLECHPATEGSWSHPHYRFRIFWVFLR